MVSRRYIDPKKLRQIAFDVARVLDERKNRGEKPPTNRRMADWLGYSVHAIVRAKELIDAERRS